jgi:hypothetical protein
MHTHPCSRALSLVAQYFNRCKERVKVQQCGGQKYAKYAHTICIENRYLSNGLRDLYGTKTKRSGMAARALYDN